jgi:hypothetical protein
LKLLFHPSANIVRYGVARAHSLAQSEKKQA